MSLNNSIKDRLVDVLYDEWLKYDYTDKFKYMSEKEINEYKDDYLYKKVEWMINDIIDDFYIRVVRNE